MNVFYQTAKIIREALEEALCRSLIFLSIVKTFVLAYSHFFLNIKQHLKSLMFHIELFKRYSLFNFLLQLDVFNDTYCSWFIDVHSTDGSKIIRALEKIRVKKLIPNAAL